MEARYRFAVTFRLDPGEVRVDPRRFQTAMYREAAPPGEAGWLFFRDHLWRGEMNDADHAREMAENALGVPVESVDFRAFETDEEYLDALREEIADDLSAFRAETVEEVLSKYLGSAIEIESGN